MESQITSLRELLQKTGYRQITLWKAINRVLLPADEVQSLLAPFGISLDEVLVDPYDCSNTYTSFSQTNISRLMTKPLCEVPFEWMRVVCAIIQLNSKGKYCCEVESIENSLLRNKRGVGRLTLTTTPD